MRQHPDEEEWGNTTANWGVFDLHCPNNSMFTPIGVSGGNEARTDGAQFWRTKPQ
jgi:hypothetical protein